MRGTCETPTGQGNWGSCGLRDPPPTTAWSREIGWIQPQPSPFAAREDVRPSGCWGVVLGGGRRGTSRGGRGSLKPSGFTWGFAGSSYEAKPTPGAPHGGSSNTQGTGCNVEIGDYPPQGVSATLLDPAVSRGVMAEADYSSLIS